jgi:hypothetical protein
VGGAGRASDDRGDSSAGAECETGPEQHGPAAGLINRRARGPRPTRRRSPGRRALSLSPPSMAIAARAGSGRRQASRRAGGASHTERLSLIRSAFLNEGGVSPEKAAVRRLAATRAGPICRGCGGQELEVWSPARDHRVRGTEP